jgi:hypothetical protein
MLNLGILNCAGRGNENYRTSVRRVRLNEIITDIAGDYLTTDRETKTAHDIVYPRNDVSRRIPVLHSEKSVDNKQDELGFLVCSDNIGWVHNTTL